MTWKTRLKVAPFVFLAPYLAGLLVFWVYPVLHALYLSFFRVRGLWENPTFVGIKNYMDLLSDNRFRSALANTSVYAVASVFLILGVALSLALLINQPRVKHKHLFRTAFFLPMLTSGVVIAIMFTLIFDHEYGALNNYIMVPLGIDKIRWLRDPAFVMPSIIIVGLWKYTGINTLYFLVGLQNIPTEIREAALIDGASPVQRFIQVTLPMLKPILTFVIVLAIVGSFQMFAEPYLLASGGGPSDSGLFLTVYLYITAFQNVAFGYASTIGYMIVIIIFGLSLLQMKLMGTFREDQ